MNTAIIGIGCSVLGVIAKGIFDLAVERYKKAQAVKEARDDLEASLRRQVYLWSEHAYAVRAKALKAGIGLDELPSLPKED